MTKHTPTPWFVSGVRFRMNGGEWQSINRYDLALKRDENVACVDYDPRDGLGLADAHFIVKAVNSHEALVKALQGAMVVFESMPRPTAGLVGNRVQAEWDKRVAAVRSALAGVEASAVSGDRSADDASSVVR